MSASLISALAVGFMIGSFLPNMSGRQFNFIDHIMFFTAGLLSLFAAIWLWGSVAKAQS